MRVLHLSAGNLYGGIERLLVSLAQERGHCAAMEPHFGLCFDGQVVGELRESGVPVHLLGGVRFSRPWSVWQARRTLRELLRSERFDVVVTHASWPHAVFAPAVRAVGVPLVYWAHDRSEGKHWLDRRASRVPPDFVIANSRYTQSGVANVFPGVASEVIYCPLPLKLIEDRDGIRRAVREELGTALDDVVIVMASRMEGWKGHRLLLAALRQMKGTPGWACWIAGGAQRPQETRYMDSLKAEVDRTGLAGRVRFLGQRSDVPRLLAAADIHCQPNTGGEPFGIAFVEALGAGLPVVTTRLGAAPEIVSEACALLVPPNEIGSLATALLALIGDADRRVALGAAAPARGKELCGAEKRITALAASLKNAARVGVAAA